MKKIILLFTIFLLCIPAVHADEGMWMLQLLEKLNIRDMQDKGLQLSAKDIYNADGSSIKDAIVIFGGGCTGEVVSSEGLVMTNHHCGYGSIQGLSSIENDYLSHGFWAMNREEEIPAPGLQVQFIRVIKDVTEDILEGVEGLSMEEREKKISQNRNNIVKRTESENPDKQIQVKSFFGGNQYVLFIMEVYRDIRLVGTPPNSVGKFGGDTDNWMWPRQTGDFALFRIYSAPDGSPARYSKDNVPYKAPVHLEISARGYKEGDFAMIIGFPGTTERYMTSFEVEQRLESSNATRIFVRGVRQDILAKEMEARDDVRIKYAAKYASSSNYWKNSIGMNRGLRKLNTKALKEAQEAEFMRWVDAEPGREVYRDALPMIKESVEARALPQKYAQYIAEALVSPLEIMIMPANTADTLSKIKGAVPDEYKQKWIDASGDWPYKDYDEPTERKVAKAMFRIIADSLPADVQPSIFKDFINKKFRGNTDAYVDHLYNTSVFATRDKFIKALERGGGKQWADDPAAVLNNSVMNAYRKISKEANEANKKYSEGHRLYVDGITKMQTDKVHYSDANFSIRLTYGSVLPYRPADGVKYDYYTTLKGVIEKEDPSNLIEFEVPEKLKELYYAGDYGRYAQDGEMYVNFITNTDITGGNSGSPVLDAKGRLLGLAFDGNWEAMTGDIAFEPDTQRCISVDIRYVLFIIDKYAGAGYLLDEMSIAW